jgi:hypothetical protein
VYLDVRKSANFDGGVVRPSSSGSSSDSNKIGFGSATKKTLGNIFGSAKKAPSKITPMGSDYMS